MTAIENSACWCGRRDWVLCFRTRRFGLVRCGSCRTYRTDPPPLGSDEESADFYSTYYGSSSRQEENGGCGEETGASRFGKVAAQVPTLRRPGESVLDIGCGDGHLCAQLKAAGWACVIGIDVSRSRIARARETYPDVEFYDGAVDAAAIRSETLDLVIMDNVIEHLPDPASVLARARGLLKRDGRLVVITPNMRSGHFRLLGRRWTPELSPHTHIFLFTDSSLSLLLSRVGFRLEASGSFHLMPHSLRRWVARIGGGDLKGAAWSAMQEMGGFYGRLIGSGPMVYTVARVECG